MRQACGILLLSCDFHSSGSATMRECQEDSACTGENKGPRYNFLVFDTRHGRKIDLKTACEFTQTHWNFKAGIFAARQVPCCLACILTNDCTICTCVQVCILAEPFE